MAKPGATIFEFKGRIYVRPMGRGICLMRPDGTYMDAQLEDSISEGEYDAHIVVSLPPPGVSQPERTEGE